MAYFEPTAPPFITFSSPGGGVALETKSAAAARGRIAKLLTYATDIALHEVELEVIEPCLPGFAQALFGPLSPNTASLGSYVTRDDLRAMVAANAHALDLSREAWERFGAPIRVNYHQRAGLTNVGWCWYTDDETTAPARLDAWFAYLVVHDAAMLDDDATRVRIHAKWSFRLRAQDGSIATAPYPCSRVDANLCGCHASACFDLVFPYDDASSALLADHEAICTSMSLELPLSSLRVSRPNQKGDGRVLTKLRL